MTNYRYHLSKSPRKYICPECGHKTFTPYVDDWDAPVDVERFGRCDRENSCGFISYPKGDQYTPSFDDLHTFHERKPQPTFYLKREYVPHTEQPSIRDKNPLFQFLVDLFQDQGVVVAAWERYHVGTDNKNPTFSVWWFLEQDGKVCDGHFMKYKTDGHRHKTDDNGKHIYSEDWTGAKLWRAGLITDQQHENIKRPLFGLHLLNEPDAQDKKVFLFESEKTALVASIIHPDVLCLATSGCGGFKLDRLKDLKGHDVVVFPDDDTAGDKWVKILDDWDTSNEYIKRCGLKSLKRQLWTFGIGYEYTPHSGLDYCDHILNLMQPENVTPRTERVLVGDTKPLHIGDVVPENWGKYETRTARSRLADGATIPTPTHTPATDPTLTAATPEPPTTTTKDLLGVVAHGLTFKVTDVSIKDTDTDTENLPFDQVTGDVPF